MTLAPPKPRSFAGIHWKEAPAYLAVAAAVTTVISIAAFEVLLGLAIVALLFQWKQWRIPPAALPLAAFLSWLLVALAASPDPGGGVPQVKKFYVYLMLLVVFSALRTLQQVTWVTYGWIAGGCLSVLWACKQGLEIYLRTPKYLYYLYSNNDRVHGFMGHWMTFSGVTMMALLMAAALLLFGRVEGPSRIRVGAGLLLLGFGLLIAWQRTQWIGAVVGLAWLLWSKKPWLVALLPVGLGILLAANPLAIRDRVLGLINPQTSILDSRAHRAALRATGAKMIAAHPLTGIGPEQVPKAFYQYAPPEVPNPVPKSWSIEHLHNVYYHYAAELGLPALAAFLWLLGRILWDFTRARRKAGQGRWVLEGAIAVTLGMMVAGWGEVNFKDSEPLAMFLAVVACGYVVRAEANSEEFLAS